MKMLLEKNARAGGVNVGRSDAGKTITTLFQRELHLWRGAYQQPKSELSQSGRSDRPIQYATVLRGKAVYNPGIACEKLARSPAVTVYGSVRIPADRVKNSNQNGAPGRSSSDKHLPMIHCLGGVGRTGTMAAALVLRIILIVIWSRYVQISGIHGTIECWKTPHSLYN